jgi:hypothetical protein
MPCPRSCFSDESPLVTRAFNAPIAVIGTFVGGNESHVTLVVADTRCWTSRARFDTRNPPRARGLLSKGTGECEEPDGCRGHRGKAEQNNFSHTPVAGRPDAHARATPGARMATVEEEP